MAKVKVNLERSICVGSHGGFLLTIGEREYHDDVAKAIVVAGFGEYVDKPVVVEPVVDAEPIVIMQDEQPAVEEKQHVTPENKMMPPAPQNKHKSKPANKPAKTETDNEGTL